MLENVVGYLFLQVDAEDIGYLSLEAGTEDIHQLVVKVGIEDTAHLVQKLGTEDTAHLVQEVDTERVLDNGDWVTRSENYLHAEVSCEGVELRKVDRGWEGKDELQIGSVVFQEMDSESNVEVHEEEVGHMDSYKVEGHMDMMAVDMGKVVIAGVVVDMVGLKEVAGIHIHSYMDTQDCIYP